MAFKKTLQNRFVYCVWNWGNLKKNLWVSLNTFNYLTIMYSYNSRLLKYWIHFHTKILLFFLVKDYHPRDHPRFLPTFWPSKTWLPTTLLYWTAVHFDDLMDATLYSLHHNLNIILINFFQFIKNYLLLKRQSSRKRMWRKLHFFVLVFFNKVSASFHNCGEIGWFHWQWILLIDSTPINVSSRFILMIL